MHAVKMIHKYTTLYFSLTDYLSNLTPSLFLSPSFSHSPDLFLSFFLILRHFWFCFFYQSFCLSCSMLVFTWCIWGCVYFLTNSSVLILVYFMQRFSWANQQGSGSWGPVSSLDDGANSASLYPRARWVQVGKVRFASLARQILRRIEAGKYWSW